MSRARPTRLALVLLALVTPGLGAQSRLSVVHDSGAPTQVIEVVAHQGFAAFDAQALEGLGWTLQPREGGLQATYSPTGIQVDIRAGTPFLRWGEGGVQLADAPYMRSGHILLPVQFLVDVIPWKLPQDFGYETGSWVLAVRDAVEAPDSTTLADTVDLPPQDPTRLVVIDPGHGGRDPGTTGRGGTKEKDVVLAIARALARNLQGEKNIEVRLTRDADTLIPIWQRGEEATEWKGAGYGVFISLHANALPNSRATRGFETYFLSEARTDHERRVAALENSAMELEAETDEPQEASPDLSFILTELRNLDSTHWSSLLAEILQGKMAQIHPGPNRGVKQAPLAVITNSLMPAVLVEVGFLSNPEEERLLSQRSFQEDVARSLARGILEFFRRYPPGGEWEGS